MQCTAYICARVQRIRQSADRTAPGCEARELVAAIELGLRGPLVAAELGVVRRHLHFFCVDHVDEGSRSRIHHALAWVLLQRTIVRPIKKQSRVGALVIHERLFLLARFHH